MRMIAAVIKHFRLDDVRKALTEVGIHGMTTTEVKGFGRQKGHLELYRGVQYEVNFLPKVKVRVAVSEDKLSKTIAAIQKAARTGDGEEGEIGDGKIFVFNLQDVIRIRTGETGEEVL